jgi:hypothetical protein
MKSLHMLCLCLIGMLSIGGASAADLPSEFLGVWRYPSEPPNECKSTDWKGVARSGSDALLSVSKEAIEFWEDGCKILRSTNRKSVDLGNMREAEVELACTGEGMAWRTRELWHVEEINRRKILVTVLLKTYYVRDDAGKAVKSSNDADKKVTIYLECK